MTSQAYCVKCRTMRNMKGEHKVKINSRLALQGHCSKCGTKMSKFIGN